MIDPKSKAAAEICDAYAPLAEAASTMNPLEFSEAYDGEMRLWGKPKPIYLCVRVLETDYLWNLTDLSYDGFDRSITCISEQ